MIQRFFILCCLLACFGFSLTAQSVEIPKSKKVVSPAMMLEDARDLSQTNPAQAIQQIEQIIRRLNKKRDSKIEGEAYLLLGNIYEDIGQKELAAQRYEQALALLQRTKDNDRIAELYYKIGLIQLEQKKAKAATQSFNNCIKQAITPVLKWSCKEGLADVDLLTGNYEAGFAKLDELEKNAQNDSLALARFEAKRSQVYIAQNDISNANQSLQNSINTLPQQQKIKKKDYAIIQQTQEDLIALNKKNRGGDNLPEIELRKMTVTSQHTRQLPKDVLITENLKIADAFQKENQLADATTYIAIAKKEIDTTTAAISVAEVYKKSAEINRQQGKLQEAIDDFEKYTQAKEQALSEAEATLAQQVEIVKGQQQIDLLQRDFSLAEKDKTLLATELQTQKIITGLLTILLLAFLVFFYFLYQNVKAKRHANQKLLLKSLRTQMNPHFIFNALNSVNNFLAKNDEKAANKFLSDFSRLMRMVLDFSQKDFISFEQEMELNALYLKLEHFRFRDKFDYKIEKNGVDVFDLQVPPMLIQPFIENAVWHGLRYKKGRGELVVSLEEKNNHLLIAISDNGIGRAQSKALKTKNQKQYKSTGFENVSKRIGLINEIYEKNYKIVVEDVNIMAAETGTVVKIEIPF